MLLNKRVYSLVPVPSSGLKHAVVLQIYIQHQQVFAVHITDDYSILLELTEAMHRNTENYYQDKVKKVKSSKVSYLSFGVSVVQQVYCNTFTKQKLNEFSCVKRFSMKTNVLKRCSFLNSCVSKMNCARN